LQNLLNVNFEVFSVNLKLFSHTKDILLVGSLKLSGCTQNPHRYEIIFRFVSLCAYDSLYFGCTVPARTFMWSLLID